MEQVEEKYGGFPADDMGKFISLIQEILEFVREEAEGKKWALVYDGRDTGKGKVLKIFERDPKMSDSAVPESYKPIFGY